MQVSASVFSQDTRLTLKLEKVHLAQVFRAIEKRCDYHFLFKDDLFSNMERISIDAGDKKLSDILEQLLSNTGLTYREMSNKLIVIVPVKTLLQEIHLTGSILDSTNNAPLVGVTVKLKGSNIGTVSDANGRFSLTVPDNSTLVVSYVGYQTLEIPAGNKTQLNILLSPASTGLNQVVVIGYGSREKKDVTTSISSINSEQVTQNVTMSPEYAMQGRMAGVQVSGNSASPMARPTIRIRGVNTWGVADPLYVIDGIPVTELGAGIEGQIDARVSDVRGGINIMAMIDPNDIASISVLKDASAAAIYGVRAANGVILITTKKGQKGVPVVDFSARYGVQNVIKKWDVLNTPQYVDIYKRSYAANPSYTLDPWFNPSDPGYLGNSSVNENWQDAIIHKNAPTQDYSVRVSGGSERTDYSFSLGYNNTSSVLYGQDYERYTGAFKINTQLNKWLRTGINYRLAYIGGDDNYAGNLSDRALTPPWQPVYDPGGPAFQKGYAAAVVGYNPDGSWNNSKLYGDGTRINTLGMMSLNSTRYKSVRNMGNFYIEAEPVRDLKIRGNISIDAYTHNRYQFLDYEANFFDYTAGSPKDKGGGSSVGSYEERITHNFNFVKELSVSYSHNFSGHHLDVLLNGMDQQYNAGYSGSASDYMTSRNPAQWTFNADNQYTSLSSDRYIWALAGLLGRVGYNYNGKYYLDATIRHDGSSRFAENNRWGTFPAVSAAWRITAEPFMKRLDWITDMKFRAGWGQLGNQEVRNFAYVSTIEKSPLYAFGSMPGGNGLGNYSVGAAVFSFPNPGIQWEKTTTTNLGVDAVFWNKLNMTLEYYAKKTTGILQTTTLPPSVGAINDPIANIASVKNSGMELSLGYEGKIGAVGYSIGGNITTVKNEVLSTYNDVPLNTANNGRIEAGYSMNYIYGYQAGGIFPDQATANAYDAVYSDRNISQSHQPGDMWFRDLNGPANAAAGHRFYTPGGDSIVDANDRTFLGKTIPGYYYGFNLALNYKGFDVSVFFQGVGDVQKYNLARQDLENTGTRGNNMLTSALDAWTPEHLSGTPRAVVGDPAANGRVSDRFVENAGYLRLGNATLGYVFPKQVYHTLGNTVQYLRLYAAVSNGFVITKWKGLDPENDAQPMPRTFTIGITGKF